MTIDGDGGGGLVARTPAEHLDREGGRGDQSPVDDAAGAGVLAAAGFASDDPELDPDPDPDPESDPESDPEDVELELDPSFAGEVLVPVDDEDDVDDDDFEA
jgi:hypothetical protein